MLILCLLAYAVHWLVGYPQYGSRSRNYTAYHKSTPRLYRMTDEQRYKKLFGYTAPTPKPVVTVAKILPYKSFTLSTELIKEIEKRVKNYELLGSVV